MDQPQFLETKVTQLTEENDIGHKLAMSLRSAYLTMHRATNACFAQHGVTADSFTLLTALVKYGSMSQKELTQHISSDANTVSAMLNRLEQIQYIKRKRDEQDGRSRMVSLTAKGQTVQTELWQKSTQLRIKMIEIVGIEQAKQLILDLTNFSKKLNAVNNQT